MEKYKQGNRTIKQREDGKAIEGALLVEGNINEIESIQTSMKNYQVVFKDKGIRGLQRALKENSNSWKTIGLHIAVTGSSGSGKSAFINAIRDVTAEDEDGAEVGVTETTMKLTPFKHPSNPNLIVWDMPGVGTPNFTRDKYIECVKFDRYDFFMILSKGRFTEEDLWLAKEIRKRGKRFYFIRTNIDSDIQNNKRSNPKSHSTHELMNKVTRTCQENLEKAGFDKPRVFLVDNFDRQKYDFGRLEIQLVDDSEGLKMEAMALSLSTLTQEILQKKKEVLEKRIDDKAMEIACLEDDYEEQINIFEAEMTLYRTQFSLDKTELSVNKDILGLSEENLKEFQDYFTKMSATTENSLYKKIYALFGDAKRWMRRFERLLQKWGWLKVKYSHSLLQFSCVALLHNLEEFHKTALKVYNLDVQKGLVESVMSVEKKQQ